MRVLHLAFLALVILSGLTAAPAAAAAGPRGQSACAYALLSLDVSSEHNVRLLRKCAPKGQEDLFVARGVKAAQAAAAARARAAAPPPPSGAAAFGQGVVWSAGALWSAMVALYAATAWLAWPLTILALGYVASRVVDPLAKHVWRRDPPDVVAPGGDIVLARNLTQTPSNADQADALAQSGVLLNAFPNARQAMEDTLDPITQVPLIAARGTVAQYFERAYAAMLASQMRVLQTLVRRQQSTLAHVQVYYDDATESGAGISFRDWLDYLVRYGLVEKTAVAGGNALTDVSITRAGRLFLAWCDVNRYSPQTVGAAGRPF